MGPTVPRLSRFELQCLRRLSARGEASVREVQGDLPGDPGYSTVRKIFERLEEKQAVERVRRDGRAWIYRPLASPAALVRREVRRLLEGLFDGRGASLVAQLADMKAISLEELQELEQRLSEEDADRPARRRRRPAKTPEGGGA